MEREEVSHDGEYQPVAWEVFILRVTREAGRPWLGEVVHLPDRYAVQFANLSQAMAFIASFLPGDLPPTEV